MGSKHFYRAALTALFLVFIFRAGAEIRYAPELNAGGIRRIKEAVALIETVLPGNPLTRWSYRYGDSRYEGDIWIGSEDLDESTLGQWDGARIIINAQRLEDESREELALIIYHESAHADHHYRDIEAVVLNEYRAFFSPRQFLLFEMINEGLAVYKECALRYLFGSNRQSEHKYRNKPSLSRYEEDFYAYYKDLRRWLKGNGHTAKLEGSGFEEALFREFIVGFLSDPWYLDYYMPSQTRHFEILRGKDFAVSPVFCVPAYAALSEATSVYLVLDRYLEKNAPEGMSPGISARDLEIRFKDILASFEKQQDEKEDSPSGAGPGRPPHLYFLSAFNQSQRNFETINVRYREIPAGMEIRYKNDFSPKMIESFFTLIESLRAAKEKG
ncbi:MAG: hypothetical protein LBN92_02150 [Treponema sp.]|jgi:hypothetical protein|nr:hypothetical protein [Treponema sp.]